MIRYNWQRKDWPHFTFGTKEADTHLFAFAERVGHVTGLLKGLSEEAQSDALIEIMIAEAMKTSEIEGEYISRQDVASSIRKNLGLVQVVSPIKDKKAEGIAKLMLDVRRTFSEPLTQEKLFAWHTLIFPDTTSISIGSWRTHEDPMQIVSGAAGKEKVHFEAPPSSSVPLEMDRFISWFNDTSPGSKNEITKAPVRSAVAHLYFETIHPFEDGNGRIGRAIAEKALSQGMNRPVLLSLSRTIEANRKEYYNALEKAQSSLNITSWVNYFSKTVLDAQIEEEKQIEFTLKKVKFFDRFKTQLNDRQLIVVQRMFEEGPVGFKGGMNTRKYVSIIKTSNSTATRDLQDLVAKEILLPIGGGRSSRYELNI